MAIPDHQAVMLPLLKRLADGKEHKHSNLIDELGSEFGLTEEELSERLPSRTQKVFTNRVGWARTHLKKVYEEDAKLLAALRSESHAVTFFPDFQPDLQR